MIIESLKLKLRKLNHKDLLRVVLPLVVLIIIPATVYLASQSQDIRQHAQTAGGLGGDATGGTNGGGAQNYGGTVGGNGQTSNAGAINGALGDQHPAETIGYDEKTGTVGNFPDKNTSGVNDLPGNTHGKAITFEGVTMIIGNSAADSYAIGVGGTKTSIADLATQMHQADDRIKNGTSTDIATDKAIRDGNKDVIESYNDAIGVGQGRPGGANQTNAAAGAANAATTASYALSGSQVAFVQGTDLGTKLQTPSTQISVPSDGVTTTRQSGGKTVTSTTVKFQKQ